MTNEEIRIKVPMLYNDLGDGKECIIAGYNDINQIQNLTRADERDKVIGEIDLEQILIRLNMVKKCGTCVRCDEMLDYIIEKLNSLREAK